MMTRCELGLRSFCMLVALSFAAACGDDDTADGDEPTAGTAGSTTGGSGGSAARGGSGGTAGRGQSGATATAGAGGAGRAGAGGAGDDDDDEHDDDEAGSGGRGSGPVGGAGGSEADAGPGDDEPSAGAGGSTAAGGTGGAATGGTGAGQAETHTVSSMNGSLVFTPADLTIAVGDKVRFEMSSSHNAVEVSKDTYDSRGETALSGGFNVGFGATQDVTFNTAGIHYFVCQPHADRNMIGTITVE